MRLLAREASAVADAVPERRARTFSARRLLWPARKAALPPRKYGMPDEGLPAADVIQQRRRGGGALGGLILLITVIAIVFALKYARDALIPITLAVFFGYAMMPLVTWLKKRAHLPQALGAAIALLLLVSSIALAAVMVQPQVAHFLDTLPKATQKLKGVLHRTALDRTSAVRRLTTAADELERAAGEGPRRPDPSLSLFNLREYLWSGTAKMVNVIAQGVIVLALSYFLLVSGNDFKRKIVRVSGDRLRHKKLTVHILDEIDLQIQRYLMIQLTTSVAVGVLTGLAFAIIGLDNPLFWGITAGVLHLIPYVGPTLVIATAALFAYVQFSTTDSVLLIVVSATTIVGVIGLGVVPWLTQRVAQMNAVATFSTLIVWDWLWGVPGLLLGVPIMMAVMVIGEHVELLRPFAEFLGVEPSRTPVTGVVPSGQEPLTGDR
jgi:predicted PurR-regulated permease PerM